MNLLDGELRQLMAAAAALEPEYTKADEGWSQSPFVWIRTCPSRQKGSIAERLVTAWLESHGFQVRSAPDSDCDRVVNGRRLEVKSSMLWKGGFYRFQQLRDQRYDFLMCLGISPFEAHSWVFEKAQVFEEIRRGNIVPQHGGRRGSETFWFSVDPRARPDWLQPYGGTLRQGLRRVHRITGFQPDR